MAFINELRGRVDRLADCPALAVDAADLAGSVDRLGDEALVDVLGEVAALMRDADRLRVVAAGVAARRSTREAGRNGLAQTRGHRSPVSLVQEITGGTTADAAKQVRIGESLFDGVDAEPDDPRPPSPGGDEDESAVAPEVQRPWHDPLDRALMAGEITAAQMDAVIRNLGKPPERDGEEPEGFIEAWRLAAEQLVVEAGRVRVEELAGAARQVRDTLDPAGAEERFLARYDARSFAMWTDSDGIHRARITFDDEGAAWVRSITDSAFRPRRGGPRFVDSDEKERAQRLLDDPRSNDQLCYDLLIDLLKSGSLASAEQVFGTRQAGVRLLVTEQAVAGPRDSFGRPVGVGYAEDGGHPLPGAAIEQTICSSGHVAVTVDPSGNPLDVGREQRLFTTKQRIALAVRDGGCLWPGCGMSSSYTEAHHIDEWTRDGGRTDLDRGIQLCRHHHLHLHHHGWRITRRGKDSFQLHAPPGRDGEDDPVTLHSRSALRWSWDRPPDPAPERPMRFARPRSTSAPAPVKAAGRSTASPTARQ